MTKVFGTDVVECSSAATACASLSKCSENLAAATLIATVRSNPYRAPLYASPIPPAPIGARNF
jgi:hypothetical protein